MKKFLYLSRLAMLTTALSGCFDNGSTAAPPSNFVAAPGDGRVQLTWTAEPGVDYWFFTATDPSLTAYNWTPLPNAQVYRAVDRAFYVCGLLEGDTYYFAANGRMNGGPGGPSSPTINALPYNAASAVWATSTIPSPSPTLGGVGYASLTTCVNNTTSATGNFAAVGTGGAIFTSSDGQTWNAASLPYGFSSDLYNVAGYTANLNNPANPGLRWVAVGSGGASLYSTDSGATWLVGREDLGNPALRSITQAGGIFFTVGDMGTILSSSDGITWTPHTSGTTNNLNGITHGNIYVAVGNSGTILTSTDGGNTWASHTSVTSSNLRKVASVANLIVAVGDNGTIATSKDGGATWTTQTLAGTPNLVSVVAESQLVANDTIDSWLGVIPSVQFVAIDNSGNAYLTRSNAGNTIGLTWSAISIPVGLNALVSSGFGYVAVGNAGASAYSF
jgi:hypothetical protein